jgi:hypothetical protein
MDYTAKICYNSKNNQAIVFLSKKKLGLLKEKKAQYIKIREKDIF